MAEKTCTNCGKKLPAEAKFCLNCGKALDTVQPYVRQGRSGLLTAGGVLTIIGSCVSLIGGLIALAISISTLTIYSSYYNETSGSAILALIGLFGIFGFAFGLTSGIEALRRKQFVISILGVVFLLVAGILNLLVISVPYVGIGFFLLLGLPYVVLSVLGLIFQAIRIHEFS
jgi:hypothetical protein